MSSKEYKANKAYDVNAVLEMAENAGMGVVIPPKKNRKVQRSYDKDFYRLRHLVELAAVHIRCIAIWAKIY
jgi:hypothetical protein